ncbi:Death-associated protein kinase 1 [Schistosoma japonicum]|nr:Death-associated protein kinase 1 [Schistosoma japonicum]KAH8850040.1 Death-associated protein kinase 1 [Schistosoma japonicum]
MASHEINDEYFEQSLESLDNNSHKYEISNESEVRDAIEIKDYQSLIGAIMDGDLELVDHLFTQFNNFNFQNIDEDGNSLMHLAVMSKHLKIVRYLAEHNVPLYAVNKDGETPLHIAAKLGLLLIVDYIIDVDVNLLTFVDKNGNTPLHLACLTNRSKVALSLCNAGAPLEVRNKNRKPPLLCAVTSGSESCVRVLLLAGARADTTDEVKEICRAIVMYKLQMLSDEIDKIVINYALKPIEGNTALHLAASQGDYFIIKLLAKAVSNVDVFNTLEFTPLHLAAKHGHLRTVRYLILAGADPSITSRNGITPDVMAFAQGHSKVGMLLTRMKPEKRTAWIEQLRDGTHRMPRIKLKLFGSSLVGKTQLTHSLQTGPISAYLKKKLTTVSEFAGLTGEVATNEYTLWDFSGFPSYYCFYDHFIGDISCIHLVLFNLMDSLEWRRKSVRFWLDFLFARLPIKGPLLFGGRPTEMARVILVGTHADIVQCQKDQNGFYYDEETLLFLREMITEYQDKLDIHDSVFLLDARDGNIFRNETIKDLFGRCSKFYSSGMIFSILLVFLQTLPRTNSLMIDLSNKLPEWTLNEIFPIYNLDQFAERIHEHINPLCTDEHLTTLIEHLQYAGTILFIEATSQNTNDNIVSVVTTDKNNKTTYNKSDMIVLNPNQLCNGILGKCFSERFLHRTRITGSFTLDDIQLFVREQDTQNMIRLLESFGLCVCCIVKEFRGLKSRSRKKHSTDCFELFEQISGSPLSRSLTPDNEHIDRNGSNYNNNNNDSCLNGMQFSKTIVFDISRLQDSSIVNEDIQIEMPRLNQIPLYQGLWEYNSEKNKKMIYSGLQLLASPGQFIHLMPRIQVQLRREISVNRKKLRKELTDEFSTLHFNDHNHFSTTSEFYRNSLDYNSNNNDNTNNTMCFVVVLTKFRLVSELPGLLSMSSMNDKRLENDGYNPLMKYNNVLEIFSRCLPRHVHRTFILLHETVHLITQVISNCCPNLNLEFQLLNSDDLSKHYKNPKVWDSKQLIQTLLLVIARNSHVNRTSLCSIDLQKPRTPQKQPMQCLDDPEYHYNIDIGEDQEVRDEVADEQNVSLTSFPVSNINTSQSRNRKSEDSVHLQNQLIKDLFFNNKQLAQEASNHLLNIPSYPLPITVLQKLAKHIDVTERDPCKFNAFIQYLCYPEITNLITQWSQGVCLWSTLSPTMILLNFASKYPIRFLEWALLSCYGLDIVQILYTSYILLNFSHVVFKEESMLKPIYKDDHDDNDNYGVIRSPNHLRKYTRSSSTPRNSQL